MPGMKTWAVGEEVLAAVFQDMVQNQVVAQFANLTALQAGWPNANNGSRAMCIDTFRTYTKRAAGGTGWQPDTASGIIAVTFSAGAGSITHDLGRVPGVCLVNVGQSSVNFLAVTGRTATTIAVAAWTSSASGVSGNLNIWWWAA